MSLFRIFRDLNVRRSLRWTADASATDPNRYVFNKGQHSLQVQAPEAESCSDRGGGKGTSLPISGSGENADGHVKPEQTGRTFGYPFLRAKAAASLTVEAALAMTLFLFTVLILLGIFYVIRTEIQVQTALEQTGNQLAGLPEEASQVSASLLFREKLSVNGTDTSWISGAGGGISLARSTVMGNQPVIDLVAVYRIKVPFFPDNLAEMTVVQRCRKTAFGETEFPSEDEEDDVYITLKGEVYHESMYCTYIRPVTRSVSFAEVGEMRNQDGGRFRPCSFCCTGTPSAIAWITEWGDCYHQSEQCRGLWHDVRQISRSEAVEQGRRACSKCGKSDAEG